MRKKRMTEMTTEEKHKAREIRAEHRRQQRIKAASEVGRQQLKEVKAKWWKQPSKEDLRDGCKSLGERIKKNRYEKALTLQKVADITGIPAKRISQIEKGGDSTLTELWKISCAIQHPLDDLTTPSLSKSRKPQSKTEPNLG